MKLKLLLVIFLCFKNARTNLIKREFKKQNTNNDSEIKQMIVENSIYEGIKEEEIDQAHRTDSLSIFILISVLLLSILAGWLFRLKSNGYFHETGMSMILGIITGGGIRLILYFLTIQTENNITTDKLQINNNNHTKNSTNNTVHELISNQLTSSVSIHVLNMTKTKSPFIAPSKVMIDFNNNTYSYKLEVPYPTSNATKKKSQDVEQIEEKSSFNPEVFFYVLLPPIVFFASYQLDKHFFFRNIGSILALAFVGTLISAITIALITYGYSEYFGCCAHGYTFSEAMIFGAINSATDPVTILAIFNDCCVNHDLNALVFGESVFNDAVAIVLYRSILTYTAYDFGAAHEFSVLSLFEAVAQFFHLFIGSFLIGFSVSVASSLFTKWTKIGLFPLLETAFLILISYSSFLLAEIFNWSGIVSVLVCGIAQKHYTYHNMSPATAVRLSQFFELFVYIGDTFIFAYIGLSVFLFSEHVWDWKFLGVSFFSLQVARALNIYPIVFFLNLNRDRKIPASHQHMLMWSGLRGAMAFALAIKNTASVTRRLILTATLFSVIISVLFQGGLTFFIIKLLKIEVEKEETNLDDDKKVLWNNMLGPHHEQQRETNESNSVGVDETNGIIKSVTTRLELQNNHFLKYLYLLDQKYLRPFLIFRSE